MNIRTLGLLACFATCGFADTCFVGSGFGDAVYSFTFTGTDTSEGSTLFTGLGGPDGIAFSPDGSTVYVTGNTTYPYGYVYTFPAAGPYTSPTMLETMIGDPLGIAITKDGATAIVTSTDANTIYQFPTAGPDYTATAFTSTSPITTPCIIVFDQNDTAYVCAYGNAGVYAVTFDLNANTYDSTLISGFETTVSSGVAVSSDGYLYVTCSVMDMNRGNIYRVPLDNLDATPTLVSETGLEWLDGVAISDDGQTLYTVSYGNGVYAVPLASLPATVQPTNFSQAAEVMTLGIYFPFGSTAIPLAGLTGNNYTYANYLNNNAPSATIALFSSLTGSPLSAALESAAPTRNAFTTYASQNGFLASSQVVTDHSRQRRFRQQVRSNSAVAALDIPKEELIADNSANLKRSRTNANGANVWLTPFGEYAREKGQNQTPPFTMSLGGAVAAVEYQSCEANAVGFGAAYVYTHVHEENGAGNANLNQGYLTFYGTVNAAKWYFDLGVWGGYYHSNNQRKIAIPGVVSSAQSSIHGWQAAPHFEIGYNSGLKSFGVEPFAMGDWVANWEHAFQEHGAGPLNHGQNGRFCSFLRAESGLRFHEIVIFSWGDLVLREKGSYVYQKGFHTGNINAFLVGSPGSFTVTTLTSAQNLGAVEFSMLFISNKANPPYLDLRYQGEFGSQYQSHQGMVEIGKSF